MATAADSKRVMEKHKLKPKDVLGVLNFAASNNLERGVADRVCSAVTQALHDIKGYSNLRLIVDHPPSEPTFDVYLVSAMSSKAETPP